MLVSGLLAVLKIAAGLLGHSIAVLADGFESAGDVFTSGLVLLALTFALKPADEDHPYGHGRAEILTGLFIGLVLTAVGAVISFNAVLRLGQPHEGPARFVVWPLLVSLGAKSGLATYKYRHSKRMRSAALHADAANDAMDAVSATVALIAVLVALYDPMRFLDADRCGAFVVGLIVIASGLRVSHSTAMQLMDTMPAERLMSEIRAAAAIVPGVEGVEKCFARKTGLRYHVDLHLEVDPDMTVRESHDIAHEVRLSILQRLDWVADVLVHVEPAP